MSESQIEAVDCSVPDEAVISRAAAVLEAGGLVVAPTETRYGLLVRADWRRAIQRLYRVKRRSLALPTALFVERVEDVSRYGEMNQVARRIADRFLPGPLTLVLKAVVKLEAPLVVDGNVGIRVSSAPTVTMLLRRFDFPVTATSANRTGEREHETVEDIARVFGGEIDLYLDGGRLDCPLSTVVDVSSGSPRILRKGAVDDSEIASVANCQLI